MALQNQIHIHSVDTSAFYTEEEKRIAKPLGILYSKRYEIKSKKSESRTEWERNVYKLINKRIGVIKNNLRQSFMDNSGGVRELTIENLNDISTVSVFESILTRTMEFKIGKLSKDIIIVKTFFYDILKDLAINGFTLEGEKYILFTASAGQIRTKKTVYIKESSWEKYKNSLTCGLSIEKINEMGGINVNKYLAYLALTNSATDLWSNFDIDKCIVVDDFETEITTRVDFINEKTYEITPKINMQIPIPHTDGVGLMLPKVSSKSFMIRIPWVKGLLVPFRFDVFTKEYKDTHPNCHIIKDIYGKEYDILKDDIQVIFTKSQFKMYKYYKSWDEYKSMYKLYNCQAGKCNEDPDRRRNAKINYQMMQTLIDITNDELVTLASRLNSDIEKLATDRDTMLKVMGVTEYNNDKNYLQQALEIYPEMLQDEYCKKTLKDIKKKLVKEGRAGRLPLKAKYTFLIPDLYAFCEWLFLGIEVPEGILKNGEVSCSIYKKVKELDVLRSPHLYMEHAIRNNVITKQTNRWFITDGIYTSTFDPISKILQFDVDGDSALVCAEETVVEVAKRNCESNDIIPLYYEMKKAKSTQLDNEVFYNGMINAYSGGNIGIVSNDITKIWNSDCIDINVIKYLCMESNFTIDYAKTLYKPKRPDSVNLLIKSYTKSKTPAFFMYAKDKESHQVEHRNSSTVNRLYDIIKDRRLKFDKDTLGKFDYYNLMNHDEIIVDKDVIDKFVYLNRRVSMMIKYDEYDTKDKLYVWNKIRNEILDVNGDVDVVVNSLVEYLYGKNSQSKKTLWECFGDVMVENLNINVNKKLDKGYIMCEKCGDRIKKTSSNRKYCLKCSKKSSTKTTSKEGRN